MQGLSNVLKVMQLPEYVLYSDRVRQAECDSMERLHMTQDVPYLAEWNRKQAKHAREEPQQVAHHEDSISTIFLVTREQPHVRSAAGINSTPVAKRQRVEAYVAQAIEQDPEEQALQAELAQLHAQLEAQLRKKALQAQIDMKKKALLELDQDRERLKRGQHAAQQGTLATQASLAVPAFDCDVQPISPLGMPNSAHQVVLFGSNAAAEDCPVPAPHAQKVTKAPKHPEFPQSKTIAGRYQEWIGDGQYAGIKSQLVKTRRGLALPKTKGGTHAGGARSNLQKKKHSPLAIEKLVVQGLSSSAAIALVTKVVNDFGLRGIAQQSDAFLWLASDSEARAETRELFKTGKTVKQLKTAYDIEISKAFEGEAM